jgi:type II secretory pathway predicted ATPase ExeA
VNELSDFKARPVETPSWLAPWRDGGLCRLPMYQNHFGFSRSIFADGVAQDEFVFRTVTADRTTRDLAAALTRRDAVAILAGASGTGKTTLATDALKSVGTRLAFSCISQAPLSAHELLEQLLVDFGFEPYRRSRVERLQLWRQFLSEMTATDSRICLLVESADTIAPEVMLALHGLTAADAALSRGANVILTTTERPEALLTAANMLAFSQRVCLRRRIDPLSEPEVGDYLRFKLALGGVDPERILGTDVASQLFEYSGGIIRVVDNLLEAALSHAAAAGDESLTRDAVAEIAERRFGLARMTATAVDDLLAAGSETLPTDRSAEPAAFNPDEIPTLTEVLVQSGHREPRRELGRAAPR